MDGSELRPGSLTFARLLRRENIALVLLASVVLVSFSVIRASAQWIRGQRRADAAFWFRSGEASLAQGRVTDGLRAFSRATALDRDQLAYRFALAKALLAAGQIDASRQAFVALQSAYPESPDVHLGLAAVEERRGDVEATVRLRQRALYAAWPPERLDERERVRGRLIDYLLEHQMHARALPELLTLSADLPADAARHVEVGTLYLRAGEPSRAAATFARAMELDRSRPDARAGAARAAFAMKEYERAATMLTPLRALPPDLVAMRDVADAIARADPLRPGLATSEAARRLSAGLSFADRAIAACPSAAAAPGAAELRASLESPLPRRETAHGVELIAAAAALAAERCGDTGAETRAWLLIGKRYGAGA